MTHSVGLVKSKVYDFFESESDSCKCRVPKADQDQPDGDGDRLVCGIKISNNGKAGSKAANLKRHLERHHPQEFKAVCEADTEALEPKKKAARNDSTPSIST